MAQGLPIGYSASYSNLVNNVTTTIKSGAGILHTVVVNTLGTTPTIQIYDNTAASGTKIGLITPTVTGTYDYDVSFNTGLTVVTTGTGTADITVTWQ